MNKEILAYHPICSSLTLYITAVEYGVNDKVLVRWSDNQKTYKRRIYENKKGSYFVLNRNKFYLEEFTRV